jgi:hypothetical protein
VNSCRNSKI